MKNVTSILKDDFLGWGEEREICERVVFVEMGVGQEHLGSLAGARQAHGEGVPMGRVSPRGGCPHGKACGEGGWARGGCPHGEGVPTGVL